MTTPSTCAKLTLHGYFRSSCSARLRIALYYKDLDFEYVPVNIKDGFHLKEEYAKLNPMKSVPTLFIEGVTTPITQSGAALEWLEEAYPDTPALLPNDPFMRAQVRSLVNIVTNDIQPPTNMIVLQKVGKLGYDAAQWSKEFHQRGFDAFEALIKSTAGNYCFGDSISLADVCLAPAMWNAERWGVDMEPYPTIKKVYANASKHPAFQRGHWKEQPDCPENLR